MPYPPAQTHRTKAKAADSFNGINGLANLVAGTGFEPVTFGL
jgi:hypothetical protein